ncbi:MAG: stage II sporulation protein M [Caldilineaceae bacterium]|nr:stage II sporulation protein M [Caldilineaceae bacterium]HRJ41577.1 stage II sporulation protein M [Caldilineaceae bacterium]
MQINRFIEKEKRGWQRLEALTATSRGNAEALSEAELYELGHLYQIAASDLALAQRDFPSHQITRYLNQLVGRTHAVLYREEALRWQQFRLFYQKSFPLLYRRLLPYTAASFLLFLLPAIIAFAVVWQTPDHIYTLLGQDIASLVHTVEEGELWTEIAPSVRSSASATILTNNIGVMFYAFAGSLTGGLLTLYILLFNGLSLGAIFGLLQFHGMSPGLAEFILAHGPVELSVIFLSGGCGLFVADGLLRPGLLTRQAALVERAKTAVQLILGSVPLLIGAGLIEGFISPSGLPWPVKALVGLVTGVALHRYWLRRGLGIGD